MSLLSRFLSPITLRAKPHPLLGGAAFLGGDGERLSGRENNLLVGTLRMGYGHYRIGRAAITWGSRAGANVFVHDPLLIHSPESAALRISDYFYSSCSRVSTSLGGPVEKLWGWLTLNGGRQSQTGSRSLAQNIERLMGDAPRDWPIICAHPWNAHLAVVCGFRNVINLVPDSDPNFFVVVPEAINLTQNEESRRAAIRLGAPPERVITVGHWVPAELAENAEADSATRLRRAERGAPIRLLFSVGGAGAQAEYLADVFKRLAAKTRAGKLRLILNAGDHRRLAKNLERALRGAGLGVVRIETLSALEEFIGKHPLEGEEPPADATVISVAGPLEAVTASDRLMRVSDALVTKPSELAFFPLPKLHIRRVGDHEAASARYSSALGDGTPERREPADAADEVERWLADRSVLARMSEGVRAAAWRGIYSGAKTAVEMALARSIA